MTPSPLTDLFIIGGGINGCGIARDAAGRGYSVTLAEKGDLAGATSSASTKLFHGGLRYLEFLEVRLVREALREREVLLRAMPHISWPMRFVLPYDPQMRFESDTPVSRFVGTLMPWLKGRRPAWMIRAGLMLYDHLGGRKILPASRTLNLSTAPEGTPLQEQFTRGWEYSDCWVEDSRLVALNARDANEHGATILTRTRVTAADWHGDHWQITTRDERTGSETQHHAKMVVNAAGPWVSEILQGTLARQTPAQVRLVRGSHIVVKRLFDHDKAYFFQGTDGRIIFAIPYETDFTLIGTTDAEHSDPGTPPLCTEAEETYLLNFASQYFRAPLTHEDVIWRYSGVRPLYDDGASSATAATRDYVLVLEDGAAPLLSVFGGKITTYRRLAESALEKIASALGPRGAPWTAGAALPGGDFSVDGVEALIQDLRRDYVFLNDRWARRLVRAYGTESAEVLGSARRAEDLGRHFGATLTEREVRWLIRREYARSAEDILWRRSKLGLHMSAEERDAFTDWCATEPGLH